MRTAADLPDSVRQLLIEGRDAWYARDYGRARTMFEDVLRIATETGDRFSQAAAYHFLGNVAFNERRDDESRRFHTLALEISRHDGDHQGAATSLGGIAYVDFAEGDLEGARQKWDAAIDAYEAAEMVEAARSLRDRATDLLEGRVVLETVVHRVAATPPRPA